MRRSRVWLLGGAMALIGVVTILVPSASAVSRDAASSRAAPKGTLTIGLVTEDKTLFPLGSSFDPVIATRDIIEAPASRTATGGLRPQLALSWKQPSPSVIVLNLRKGVSFTDGEPFNSRAVIFSWHWTMNFQHGTDAEFYNEIKSIKALGNYEVRITLSSPDPLFLDGLPALYIYPPKYAAKEGYVKYGHHPIGTGPFVFVKWVRGSYVEFAANPHYYNPASVRLSKIIFRFISDSNARVAALKSGQIQIAYDIPPELAKGVRSRPGLKVETALDYHVYNLEINNLGANASSPIAAKDVRLAINYAIDKQAIIKNILDGYAKALPSFIGPAMFGYDRSLKPIPYNPQKAKQLLNAAGYGSGFKVNMSCPEAVYTDVAQICQAIVGYLEQVGITPTFAMEESTTYWNAELAKSPTTLFYEVWGDNNFDPGSQIQGAFAVDPKYLPNGTTLPKGVLPNQWANYYDPRIMTYYRQYLSGKTTVAKQHVLYAFQKYEQANPAFGWLWQEDAIDGISKRVHGFTKFSSERDDTEAGVSLTP